MKKSTVDDEYPNGSKRLFVPAVETKAETTVINSKFIATCAPVFSVEEAKDFILKIRKTYPDATHHVPAYVIGHQSSTVCYCNDDGEPAGSAGRPILTVLTGSGMGDIAIVVTRYFGGTKLGIGGLVHAYGGAAKKVLSIVPRAEKVLMDSFQFDIDYHLFELIKNLFNTENVLLIDHIFAEKITISAKVESFRFPEIEAKLNELSNGKIILEKISERKMEIRPI